MSEHHDKDLDFATEPLFYKLNQKKYATATTGILLQLW